MITHDTLQERKERKKRREETRKREVRDTAPMTFIELSLFVNLN